MDKSTRSLRRLPARSAKSAERNLSKGRTIFETDSPLPAVISPRLSRRMLKEPERKEINTKKASSPRKRSRSRSSARKRPELIKEAKEIKEKEVVVEGLSSRSGKAISPPVTKIVSRLKEGIEHVRNSVSPEIEEVVRRSLSRFEEVKSEVVSTILTRRGAADQRRAASVSVVNSISGVPSEDIVEEEEVKEEKNAMLTNHTGAQKNEKSPIHRDTKKVNYFKIVGLILLGMTICALVLVAHIICTKDDCRLLFSNLPKTLDYSQYFDSYIWPIYSVSLILLYIGCHLIFRKQRKPQHFSVVGMVSSALLLGSMWASYWYFGSLQQVRVLPLIGASIVHTLALVAFAGTSSTLGSVQLEQLAVLSSSIMLVLLNACLFATEFARTFPNFGVLLLCGLQAHISLDHLLLPLLSLGLGPFGFLWLSLRPFIFLLPQIYISANNVALGTYSKIGIVILHLVGYVLFRYSVTVKINFLRDPYSQRFSKSTVCGDYSGGPWGLVRHPQLVGLLLCELSWAAATLPSHVAAVLMPLSVVSVMLFARTADRRLSRTYRAKISSSLIPLIPY